MISNIAYPDMRRAVCTKTPLTFSPQHSDLRLLMIPTLKFQITEIYLNLDNF